MLFLLGHFLFGYFQVPYFFLFPNLIGSGYFLLSLSRREFQKHISVQKTITHRWNLVIHMTLIHCIQIVVVQISQTFLGKVFLDPTDISIAYAIFLAILDLVAIVVVVDFDRVWRRKFQVRLLTILNVFIFDLDC